MTATTGERRAIATHFVFRGGFVLICASIGVAFWGTIIWLVMWAMEVTP